MNGGEENSVIVRQLNDCLNQDELDRCTDILDEDFVLHNFRADYRGRKSFARMFSEIRNSFPDIHFNIEEQVADGDRVVSMITVTGTHAGTFEEVPATNRKVKTTGLVLYRLSDGRVVEQWSEFNIYGLLNQIGGRPPSR